MTDEEHAKAIHSASDSLHRAIKAAWEDGLVTEVVLTEPHFKPWELYLTVKRTHVIAQSQGEIWHHAAPVEVLAPDPQDSLGHHGVKDRDRR